MLAWATASFSLAVFVSVFGFVSASALAADEGKGKSGAKTYSIDTSGTTQEVRAGAGGTFKLQIKPAEGYHVSSEAPLKITLKGEGLELAKPALGQGDVEDKSSQAPSFKVAFSTKAKGKGMINADAMFFVCSESLCERKTEKVAVAIDVKP